MTLRLRDPEGVNLIGVETGREHLSVTSLSALLNCQRRYQLHYETRLRLRDKPTALSLGGAYAKALEERDPTAGSRALAAERTIWSQEDQDRLEIDCAIVEACAETYLAHWPERDDELREFGFRVRLRNPWTGSPSRTFDLLGYADGLFPSMGNWGLIENKLVGQVTQVSVKRLPLDRQLALMAYGVWRATAVPVVDVDYRFVRKPSIRQRQGETVAEFTERLREDYRTRPDFYCVEEHLVRSAEDLLRIEAELWVWADQLRQAKATGFWPRNTSHCADFGGCAYIPVCVGDPDAEHLYEIKPRSDERPA